MLLRRVLALVGVVVVAVSSAGLSAAGASAARASTAPHSTLHWTSCGDGFQCAHLPVPLTSSPHSPTISLALARLPAADPSERIGSLVVNPGGPGASAVEYVREGAKMLPATIRDHFDVVGFDPRGVAGSAPIVCTSRLDPLYNLQFAPVNNAAYQALVAGFKTFVAQCEQKAGKELPYVSTERTAQDMDRVRAALGDPKLTYLGYSYGTYLGALYADRYPTRIRAMVLDGAVDPTLSAAAGEIQQAQGFEHDLDLFLQNCSVDTSCTFHSGGDAGAAYDALRARLNTTSLPASGAARAGPWTPPSSTSASPSSCTRARRPGRTSPRRSSRPRRGTAAPCSNPPTSTPAATPTAPTTRARTPSGRSAASTGPTSAGSPACRASRTRPRRSRPASAGRS